MRLRIICGTADIDIEQGVKNGFGVDNRAGIRNGVGPFQLELEKENMLGCIERGSPKPKKEEPLPKEDKQQ